MVVVDRWTNAKTFAAAEVPQFAIVRFVVSDNRESHGAHRGGIKVVCPVAVLQGKIASARVDWRSRLRVSSV